MGKKTKTTTYGDVLNKHSLDDVKKFIIQSRLKCRSTNFLKPDAI